MRARQIIALAICLSTSFGRARADEFEDDFQDDFGKLPPPRESSAPVEADGSPREQNNVEGAGGSGPPAGPYPAWQTATKPAASPPPTTRNADGQNFVHPAVEGPIGGVHVVDARSGSPGTFRVALHASFFRKNGFIAADDKHRHASTALNVNFTPIEHLELAAQLATYSTENQTTDPRVVQVIGDTHLFVKGFARVLPWLTAGGDLGLALLNGVGTIGVAGPATSVGLRASSTFDLRALAPKIPLLARANLRYLFDNSGRLIRDVERARYASLANPSSPEDEYRHLVNPGQRYALRVNRVDRIGLGFGAEVPLTPHEHVLVNPLLEWGFALPVNRQDYDCVSTRLASDREGG